jgi:hypothetical protein
LKNRPLNTVAQLSGAVAIALATLAQAANAGVVATNRTHPATERSHFRPIFTTLPARNVDFASLPLQAAANSTLPFFTDSVKSPLNGQTYSYSILGTNPKSSLTTTKIHYVPIALRVHFKDGTVLDPTQPGCNDSVSVVKRFFKSPLFEDVPLTSNGIDVGTTQIIDAFQRAEFWSLTQGSGYHVLLHRAPKSPIRIIDYTPTGPQTTYTGVCSGQNHNLGEIDPNVYDTELQSLTNQYATTTELPIIMAYNVVLGDGSNCCIIGYHSAYGRSTGTQVYANGAYVDAGNFSAPIDDIHAWTHELGETFNDPFVNNGTPAWGHVGQVSGCQNNLEVGDPLTGTPFLVKYHGFKYHPQELAFFDWFFRTPSQGTGGLFSFEGTFTSSQAACH